MSKLGKKIFIRKAITLASLFLMLFYFIPIQVAHAAAPTYVQANQNDPDTAWHTQDSTPALTGSTIGGTTVTVTVNSFTCVSPVVASGWSCDGSFITTPLTANVMYPIQMVASNADGSITVTDTTGVIVDTIAPIISEKVPVASLTADNTPQYDFYTDSYGVISYTGGGGCSSGQTTAYASWQRIDFNHLNDGLYNHCSLYITDSAGNQSNTIDISPFTVDATGPIGGLLTMKTNLFPSGISVASPNGSGVYALPALSLDGVDVFDSLSVVVTDTHLNTANVPVYVDGIVNGYMHYNSGVWDYAGQTAVPNFSLGTHNLIATFSDTAGNTTTLTARFTTDNTAPTITLPLNEVNPTLEATGPLTMFTSHPTVVDNVDPIPIFTNDTPAGSLFPLGTTTVTWTATDSAGNTSHVTQTITIMDTTSPKFDPFSNITAEATSSVGAAVIFAPTATDVTGTPTVTCDPSSGSTFALGTRVVTCTAEDSSHNKSTMTFNVYVQDTTPPAISPVVDIVREATSPAGAVVTFTNPTATDLVDGNVTVTCIPPSGSTFPLGLTSVSFSAMDSHSNLSVTNFTVEVVDKIAPTYVWNHPDVDTIYKDGQPIYVEADITESGSGITDGASCSPAIHFPVGSFTGTVTYSTATGKCSGTITLADPLHYLGDGTHHITLSVADNAGNSAISADRNILIDNTAPTITITNPSTNPAQSKTMTASTNEGTLSMAINAVGVTTCNAALSFDTYASTIFTSESENGKTICYRAIDTVGNVTYSLSDAIAGIDTTPPPVPSMLDMQDASDSGVSNSDNITNLNPIFNLIGVADTDYYQMYWWSNSMSQWLPLLGINPGTQKTWNTSGFGSDYTYRLALTAIDALGNESAMSSYLDWTIDDHAPTTTEITAPQNNETLKGTYTIVANASGDFSGIDKVEFYHQGVVTPIGTDNDSSNGFSVDWDSTSVVDGARQLKVIAYDEAGNSTTSNLIDVTVDNTAPTVVSVDSDGQTYSSSTLSPHTIKITFSEDIANTPIIGINPIPIDYQTVGDCGDGNTKTFCFDYTIPTNLDTQHRIHISGAQDIAGNMMAEDINHTFNIDTVNPTAAISYDISALTNTDVVATITPSEPLSVTNNGGSFNYTFTNNGSFTFQLVDMYGNTSTAVAIVNNIDKTAPIITLNSDASMSLTVGEKFVDPGASTDDGSLITITGTVNTSVVGTYILKYNSTDLAGNQAIEVTRTVRVIAPALISAITPIQGVPQILGDVLGVQSANAEPTTPDNAVQGNETNNSDTKEVKGDQRQDNSKNDVKGDSWWNWWYLLIILAVLGGGYWVFARRRK